MGHIRALQPPPRNLNELPLRLAKILDQVNPVEITILRMPRRCEAIIIRRELLEIIFVAYITYTYITEK